MKRAAFLSALLLAATLPLSASAAVLMAEEELTIVIPLDDDTYAAGGTVSLQESIEGDLFIAGGEMSIQGSIEEDLVALGGDIAIGGPVGDDVRILGGNVTITSSIGDDLIIVGGEVTVAESAEIGGDVHVYGGTAVIDGAVGGNLLIRSGTAKVSGEIAGDADVRADTVRFSASVQGNAILSSNDLKIQNTAYFAQDVHYWQPQGPYYFAGATVQGKAEYDESLSYQALDEMKKTAGEAFAAGLLAIAGYNLLSSALLILILVLVTKTYFVDGAKRLQKEPLLSLWYGFLYLLVTPFIALFFCLTVIGIPIGLFIGVLYLFTVFFAKPFTAVLLAKWVQLHYEKKWGALLLFLAAVGFYVVLRILVLVPLVGSMVVLVATLMMFGALSHTEYQKFMKVR